MTLYLRDVINNSRYCRKGKLYRSYMVQFLLSLSMAEWHGVHPFDIIQVFHDDL